MISIQDICLFLEKLAPTHLQESYDNAGLIYGNPALEVKHILVSLDATEDIVFEAAREQANLVVSHHPIVFRGIKKFSYQDYVARSLIAAIKNEIGLYAIHTNLDNVSHGVNAKICERIGIQNPKILVPKVPLPTSENVGAGMVGQLASPMPVADFLAHLKASMKLPLIKHTRFKADDKIERVAVCGGAGSFLLADAMRAKADIFITADYKYHEFFDADDKIIIADIGHYESEIYTCELLAEQLQTAFPTIAVRIANTNTNPVRYFI
ncbi:MAG: Nif3-like dinuclear metal center hexameric protein [Bernardetiaceae bacterium]|nr:Nif3-like dinuclear metal center hexameric protein [Bernardetiaceae bacterium]